MNDVCHLCMERNVGNKSIYTGLTSIYALLKFSGNSHRCVAQCGFNFEFDNFIHCIEESAQMEVRFISEDYFICEIFFGCKNQEKKRMLSC